MAGISMSAERGMLEDTNAETVRFRKIIALHGIDNSPNCTANTDSVSIYTAPCPPPSKDIIFK